MTTPLRIVFAGTPEFAAEHLLALLQSTHQVVAVYTQPDRPAGRGKKRLPSATKQLALQHNIPVYQPENLKDTEAQRELAELKADIMVVVAYGLLLPQTVLDTPSMGCINVHGSILPRWRGAAPIQRSLWAGDNETGITIMQMDAGLDTGDMLHIHTIPIEHQDTSASLYAKLAKIGPQALVYTLANFDQLTAIKQDSSQATYAPKLSKQEAFLDWRTSAVQLERNIRAFNPWPVCWTQINATSIKVWQGHAEPGYQSNAEPGTILRAEKQGIVIATSEGALNLTKLQLPGKKPMSVQDLLNGRQDWFTVGTVLPSQYE